MRAPNASHARCCVLPMPDEPHEYEPSGAARISATSSRMLAAFTNGDTATTLGTTTTSATGARSLIGSNASFIMCGAIACALLVARSSV